MRRGFWVLPPSLQNRHNFATFWVFGKTLLGYVRQSTRPRKNLPRNVKISSKFWRFWDKHRFNFCRFWERFLIKILTILGTMFSTRTGCFFIRVILIPCNALNVIARHCQIGDPAGYCVLAGKRSTQAKEWALSRAIMRFQKRSVRRGGNRPEG